MPNRLAAEKSPYLRQHADNPVDWLPWGDEALARARAEQKPIFLSIGYSTCHWCHVMAHESFENPAIAAVLNAHFVPVKLDREERPDLDRVYMTYVQHTTGHGGWPMSVWLTPDGKPFYGGTYFPPDDRQGRPGFQTVLEAIARHWSEQREKILSGADEVVAALQRYAAEGPAHEIKPEGAPAPAPSAFALAVAAACEQGFQYFYETHDPRWGGFGGAPKFPRASALDFLFRVAALQGAQTDAGQEAVKMAAHTLQRMAEGGLHDHLGGGFHRYSVDEQWHVPHFEKMLYDQAQIARNLLEARQATGIEVYAWVARGIFDYVRRDLTSPQGAFYSAEDADSLLVAGSPEHAEGAFYVWTKAELDEALGDDAAFFCAHYGVLPDGNVAEDPRDEFRGKNVLRQRRPLAQTAEDAGLSREAAVARLLACQEKLRAVRAKRPRPSRDDKVITAWNGLMISALAKGWQILGDEADEGRDGPPGRPWDTARPAVAPYLQMATRAAEFIERELYDAATGVLHRSWREGRSNIQGFAEDYACLIQGLLDLYEAGFDIRWLQWAERLQEKMDELFWDAARGGYFNSRAGDASVIVRLKEDHDGAEPAPSSVAAMNLLRLDWMLGRPGARDQARRTVEAFRGQWSRAPHGLPGMLCAAALALESPRTVVLAGDPAASDFRALLAVLHERLGPRRALLCADGGAGQQWLAARRPYLAEMQSREGRATAYVCEDFTCLAPVDRPDELRRLLG
ncbi:MAG: thioredoxin domain-containing protein [Opitutae bacterium]|nr:thioredoxin domain-containing protein [Opitutae bacterium]